MEAIREILDRDCAALVVKERELSRFYPLLRERPTLVVTDSQAFSKVAADIPEDQRLTSFSILLARKKGDIRAYLAGIEAIDGLPEDAEILVIESCSHHRQAEDLGTVKIPRRSGSSCRRRRASPSRAKCRASRNCEGIPSSSPAATACARAGRSCRSWSDWAKPGCPSRTMASFSAWANGLLPRAVELFPELAELEAAR